LISLLIKDRCTQCNACVTACPSNVFQSVAGGYPVIARQMDCQTCYMCELYCKADALYVASDCERPETVDEAQVIASGHLGQFRRDHGWDEWTADPRYTNQHWYMGEVFRRARNPG
jgi:NAD-dependent dihydropyrimidine dehydrogenase PreA subunit